MPSVPGTYHQVAFRVRNDDGNEAAATWFANQDTNATVPVNTTKRVRYRMDEVDVSGDDAQGWTLECNKNGGAFQNVTTSSSIVKAVDSSNLTDLADCTEQLTGGSGTWLADNDGVCEDGATPYKGPWTLKKWELEFAFQIVGTDVANGDTIVLRIQSGGAMVLIRDTTLTITVSVPSSLCSRSMIGCGI